MRNSLLLSSFLLSAGIVSAEVVPHPLFSEGAVLQRGPAVTIWGQAGDGEKVVVRYREQSAETTAVQGHWSVKLGPLEAGGPQDLIINDKVIRNVEVGDVYLCSGQSNMEWPLSLSEGVDETLAEAEDSDLRLFRIQRTATPEPQPLPVVQHGWRASSPEGIRDFSAVAYHFGRELRRSRHVPIGLIEAAWGGSVAEAWTSREALAGQPGLKELIKPQEPVMSSGLFNAMINPLIPYGLRGVIWYQGEANAERASQYHVLFPTLIRDWRQRWGQPLPFMFVQLAPFSKPADKPVESDWAQLREVQRLVSQEVPNTAMAIISDLGDADIHPRRKREVGQRLALAARYLIYGESLAWSGPTLEKVSRRDSSVLVEFDHAGSGLKDPGQPLTGFTLAGVDGVFHPAQAKLVGRSQVEVHCDQVAEPRKIRYGWDIYPQINLFSAGGLPASPFESTLESGK